jgi:hypothetical protein
MEEYWYGTLDLCRTRRYITFSAMADEPITLQFLARQQQRLLDEMGSMRGEMGSMRDDMQVLTAMVMRLDGTVGLVLTELRAMHSQHQRLANRVRRLEEEREGEPR